MASALGSSKWRVLAWLGWWMAYCSKLANGLSNKLAIGLNKYSHNAAVCVADVLTGNLIVALEKERLSRVKNDGGAVGDIVRQALWAVGADVEDVAVCASNNHHRSIADEEAALIARVELGIIVEDDNLEEMLDEANLLHSSVRFEVSHHLAHALCAAASEAREPKVCVLVMDGMGERASRFREDDFDCDAGLAGWESCSHIVGARRVASFRDVPDEARECESVYALLHGEPRPIWKRWCISMDEGRFFEAWFTSPLDSFGAAYSTAAHVVFGDWNACGKLMGLAPWGAPPEERRDNVGWGQSSSWAKAASEVAARVTAHEWPRVISCNNGDDPWTSGFTVCREAVLEILQIAATALPASLASALSETCGGDFPPASTRSSLWRSFSEAGFLTASRQDKQARDACRACCAVLAYVVQTQLEEVALPLALEAVDAVGSDALVLCGGVALNSVLNGKIEARARCPVRVPPTPGDEGIALGCCARALARAGGPSLDASILPFAGPEPQHIDDDDTFTEWLCEVQAQDEVEMCAEVICRGGVVFWFQGAGEFGPRALGHRSILASAAQPSIVDVLNAAVKDREDFRPLAPSILESRAKEFFVQCDTPSPYMSRVWRARQPDVMPACVHVDGSSRPQTVSEDRADLERYARLLKAVDRISGLPLVLDTSFNTKPKEPIVNSPRGAQSSFLRAVKKSRTSFPNLDLLLAFPEKLFRAAPCPIDDKGQFPKANASRPLRRHACYDFVYSERTATSLDLHPLAMLRVYDLDESYEDPLRTRRGEYRFKDNLEAAIYDRADGSLTAYELAHTLASDTEKFTPADVYLRLAELWRATLVSLSPTDICGSTTYIS